MVVWQLYIINDTNSSCQSMPYTYPVTPFCVGDGSEYPYFKHSAVIAGTAVEIWGASKPGSQTPGRYLSCRVALSLAQAALWRWLAVHPGVAR